MERYNNFRGRSGVRAYEIGVDFIKVQFNDGDIYQYDYSSTHPSNIEHIDFAPLCADFR